MPTNQDETLPTSECPLDREAIRSLARRRGFTDRTIRAFFRAREGFVLALASALVKVRDSADPVQILTSHVKERDLRIEQLQEAIELVQLRMSRMDSRHRCRYSPEERYKILLHMQTFSLALEKTANLFLISTQTIARWMDQATKEPGNSTVGLLLKASPPLMHYSDVVRDIVLLMDRMGFGGNLRIAQTLAREGIKLSRETVRRWRKNPRKPSPATPLRKPGPILKAKRPNHIWMIDITVIPGLFGLFIFKLAVVLDVFSRMPLAGRLFIKEPTGEQMADLVARATASHGVPKHLVSDHGSQFTSAIFSAKIATVGIKQRFGAIGQAGSIAIIERFWRTVKQMLRLKTYLPLSPDDLHARLQTGLYYYAHHRPHQGLKGVTPAEMYYSKIPARPNAVRPHRAYENKTDQMLFEVAYLDPEHLLPLLIPRPAAA